MDDDERGESMEPMEEVPLIGLGASENWRVYCVVDEEKPGVDSRDEWKFQKRCFGTTNAADGWLSEILAFQQLHSRF